MRLTPGTRVGPYEVVGPLGAGGMAEVYRARDARLGRDVALKVVSEAVAANDELVARFEQEARMVGSLDHPNVLAVHDVGRHDGTPYLVTELLQGETLRSRLTRGPVPVAQALDWASQIAEGLAAAHERGITHRDLKPENVFLLRDGRVKLLDFGIAKLAQAAREPSPHPLMAETASPSVETTRAGQVFGTPGYMAPEQVRGEAADARTDIFNLGAILSEMLSGRRAFPAGPMMESGHAILHAEPEPLPADVPPALSRVVRRCLEKDPGRRFQSARDLVFFLEELRSPTGEGAALGGKRPSPNRWRWWLALAAVLGVTAGAAAVVFASPRRPVAPPSVQQLTLRRGTVFTARFAPDGRQVLFSASWANEPTRIYSTTLESRDFHPLALESAELLAVSSTGELAVALHPKWHRFDDGGEGMLARVPAVGGTPRELLEGVSYADWSPDGTSLAVIHQVDAASRLEFPIGRVLHESSGWLSHVRVSPGGNLVAFVDHASLYDYPGALIVVDAGGKKQVVVRNSAELGGVAWSSPDEVWFTQHDGTRRSLWAVKLGDRPRLIYRGTADLLLEDLGKDGRALVLNLETRAETALLRTKDRSVTALSWLGYSVLDDISRDGSLLLFSEYDRVANLSRTDGTPPVHLADAKALGLSMDARWALAIRAHEMPESRQLLLLPTGAGLARTIDVTPLEIIRRGRFFPDGKHLAVIARASESQGFAAHLVDAETGRSRPISPPDLGGYFLELSPDGKKAATVGRGGVLTLYPVDEGGKPVAFPELGAPPWVPAGWAEDGTLFVRQLYEMPARVFRLDTRTGDRRLFATVSPPESTGVTWMPRLKVSPDERIIGFTYTVQMSTVLVLDWHDSER